VDGFHFEQKPNGGRAQTQGILKNGNPEKTSKNLKTNVSFVDTQPDDASRAQMLPDYRFKMGLRMVGILISLISMMINHPDYKRSLYTHTRVNSKYLAPATSPRRNPLMYQLCHVQTPCPPTFNPVLLSLSTCSLKIVLISIEV
jgi:hypothetical protein